jgi:hypothetical protein
MHFKGLRHRWVCADCSGNCSNTPQKSARNSRTRPQWKNCGGRTKSQIWQDLLAPQVGLEPTTLRLTSEVVCSEGTGSDKKIVLRLAPKIHSSLRLRVNSVALGKGPHVLRRAAHQLRPAAYSQSVDAISREERLSAALLARMGTKDEQAGLVRPYLSKGPVL